MKKYRKEYVNPVCGYCKEIVTLYRINLYLIKYNLKDIKNFSRA